MRSRWILNASGGAILTVLLVQSGGAQQPRAAQSGADWPMYRRDVGGTGYSPLTQINSSNVASLTQSEHWRS